MDGFATSGLRPEALRKTFSAEDIGRILSECQSVREEAEESKNFLGLEQDRFLEALKTGFAVGGSTHNIFVSGFSGSEAADVLANQVRTMFKNDLPGFRKEECRDWIYLYNFTEPLKPKIVSMPRGSAVVFKNLLKYLLATCRKAIPDLVENNPEQTKFQQEYGEWLSEEQSKLAQAAKKAGLIFEIAPTGFRVQVPYPETVDMDADLKAFSLLPEDERTDLRRGFSKEVENFRSTNSQKYAELQENMNRLQKEAVRVFCLAKFEILKKTLAKDRGPEALESVKFFIEKLEESAVNNYKIFIQDESNNSPMPWPVKTEDRFLSWKVNVFVANGSQDFPVIVERSPEYERLCGKIGSEYDASGLRRYTDHTKLRAGSIARANGGCLIINLNDFLYSPNSFSFLIKTLKTQELEIKEIGAFWGYGSSDMSPEPMPLDLKVILCGSNYWWRVLNLGVPDFKEIFGVRADVLPELKETNEQIAAYVAWLRGYVRRNGLKELNDGAAGKIIEHSFRLADSQNKMSSDMRAISGVVKEASSFVSGKGAEITEIHIEKALENRFWRSNYIYERMQEFISKGVIIIPLESEAVGQISGLAVSDLGDISFGLPKLMTARAYPSARPGFISIERESGLSGNIFQKADFTVRSFLLAEYAPYVPNMCFGVSVSFEQNYGGIDGDSASLAQLYVILSEVSKVPIKQGIAITGSMSQRGAVQPIGGVNQKIEGFFDVCRACDKLDGRKGVIIPNQNTENLMLRKDVVKAVEKGLFNIWPIKTVAEGAEILFEIPFGEELDYEKDFPEGSLNSRIVTGLRNLSKASGDRTNEFKSKSREE